MKTKYSLGVFFCMIATLSWGGSFPIMTSALKHIDPFNFTAMRYSIAGVAFLIILLFREGPRALNLKGERIGLAWFLGTAGFAGFGFLVFLGQKLAGPTGALTASIVMATMPMLGLLVGWVVKGAKPPMLTLAFIVLSFTGVILVITNGNVSALLSRPQSFAAYVPLLLGALCWVVYTIGASYFPAWSPYRYTTITTLLGLTSIFAIDVILTMTGYISLPAVPDVVTVIPHLLYMSLVAGLIGVLSWNMGNKIITPLNGVLFMDIVPVTAFTVSALTGVIPSEMQVFGASITGTALIFNNLYQRQRMMRMTMASKTSTQPG
ncbi:MAG: DMT family transporter [Burkholderiales bacterium]